MKNPLIDKLRLFVGGRCPPPTKELLNGPQVNVTQGSHKDVDGSLIELVLSAEFYTSRRVKPDVPEEVIRESAARELCWFLYRDVCDDLQKIIHVAEAEGLSPQSRTFGNLIELHAQLSGRFDLNG